MRTRSIQLPRGLAGVPAALLLTSGAAAGPVLLVGDAADSHGAENVYAGLVHLEGLTSLIGLNLSHTDVSDAGLVHLKGLTHLNWLLINSTKVSDAGLEHLKGRTNLTSL